MTTSLMQNECITDNDSFIDHNCTVVPLIREAVNIELAVLYLSSQ